MMMAFACENCVACREQQGKPKERWDDLGGVRCPTCQHHASSHRVSKAAARRDAAPPAGMRPLESFGRAEA